MKTLYLAWQDRHKRSWYPVGRLTRRESKLTEYEFVYLRGAEDAQKSANPLVIPVPGFPVLTKIYRAHDVFPAFRSRAMNRSRPDLSEHLHSLGFRTSEANVIEELAVSGGHIAKDRLETFPAIEPDRDGKFEARFIVHGLPQADQSVVEKVASLDPRDRLELAFEASNRFSANAVRVKTPDQCVIGWLPRYLADVLRHRDGRKATNVEVRVGQINHKAPLSHRLLVELTGHFPPGFDPMGELEQYQPISND